MSGHPVTLRNIAESALPMLAIGPAVMGPAVLPTAVMQSLTCRDVSGS